MSFVPMRPNGTRIPVTIMRCFFELRVQVVPFAVVEKATCTTCGSTVFSRMLRVMPEAAPGATYPCVRTIGARAKCGGSKA